MASRAHWARAHGKRPVTCSGQPASSTDPSTWTTLADVTSACAGDGFGIMLGDGLGCYDLDHALTGSTLTERAAATIATIEEPIVFVERSMSGEGLHVFVLADESPGTRRPGVERYTRGRFIRTTGDRFELHLT